VSNSLVNDQVFETCVLVRESGDQQLLDLFLREWVLVSDLNHQLAQGFDVGLTEELLRETLHFLEIVFLQGHQAFAE